MWFFFIDQLKEKEETYLKNLSEEWEKQRKELERKLINELKSCEDLRKKLHSVIDGFHERFHHLTRREAEVHFLSLYSLFFCCQSCFFFAGVSL